MTVLEHMTMLCYLDFLLVRQPRALGSVAFVIDGPLALFGPPAPAKRAIQAYLQHVSHELKKNHYATRAVSSMFGEDTYYGRKFYYKTSKGQMITLTVPYLGNSSSAAVTTDPACYETLGPTLALLDPSRSERSCTRMLSSQ